MPSQSYVYPGDDSFVYEETVPVNIETYPHYYYGDAYAYYVDGRWYRRGPRGWGYYRQEPPELARQRGYVQQAPEVGPQRPYERQAPEPARERPYVRPPEAQRERPPVPGTSPPNRGAAEAQPRRDEPRPGVPRPAPPAERRPVAPHEDHAAPEREHRGP